MQMENISGMDHFWNLFKETMSQDVGDYYAYMTTNSNKFLRIYYGTAKACWTQPLAKL